MSEKTRERERAKKFTPEMMNPVMNMPGTWGTIGSTLLTVIFFWDMLRRYCPPELRRYLELEAHPLFQSVQELIEEVDITPADVAENLMPKSAKEGPEKCLLNLIHALEEAKSRQITKCTGPKDIEANHDTAAPQETPEI